MELDCGVPNIGAASAPFIGVEGAAAGRFRAAAGRFNGVLLVCLSSGLLDCVRGLLERPCEDHGLWFPMEDFGEDFGVWNMLGDGRISRLT